MAHPEHLPPGKLASEIFTVRQFRRFFKKFENYLVIKCIWLRVLHTQFSPSWFQQRVHGNVLRSFRVPRTVKVSSD